jgi:outer membrane protein assembly factor BamB
MRFRFFLIGTVVAAVVAAAGCGGSGSLAPSGSSAPAQAQRQPKAMFSWLQPGIDATHIADNTSEKKLKVRNAGKLKLGWSFPAATTILQAIVTDGKLVFGNSGDYLFAVDVKNGKQKWSFETYAGENTGYTAPAVAGNLVYVGCNVGGNTQQEGFCALSAATGKLQWSWYEDCNCAPSAFNLAGPVVSGSTVVAGYYTGGAYGKDVLIALDAATGSLLWQVAAGSGNNSLSDAIPAIDGGNVFAGTDYGLCSYQLSGGALNWCSGPSDRGTAPAVANGVIYANTVSSGFYAFDEATGAQLWQYTPSVGNGGYFSPPAIAGSTVYFSASQGGPVYALQASSGSLLYSAGGTSRSSDAISSPSIANGVLYVACNAGLCAYNAATGAALASVGPGATEAAPAIADGRVFISCGTRSSGGFGLCMYDL